MNINLANAKAQLSALVEMASKGDKVVITRRGKAVAQLTAVNNVRKRVDLAALRALTDAMPMQNESAGDFVRAMREGDRY